MRHFHAPGRVNLIGDHIDYMGGTVLPMAIDRGTDLWIETRDDRALVATSENFPGIGEVVADIDATSPQERWQWVNYLVAVAAAFRGRGIEVPGVNVRVRGSIPNGAGLSSSASLELAMAVALNQLTGAGFGATDLALVGQSAENDFIGVACGIMDQLAIAAGVAGHALAIDCGALEVTPIPFPADVAVVVANTAQRRELADSGYNQRRAACEQAQRALGEALVSIPADTADEAIAALPVELRAPSRHVITEQARVYAFAQALRDHDLAAMGDVMRASHESLRDDFGVTGPALDAMAEAAWQAPGVIGARMTGAGFGGCTVNLVDPEAVDDFIAVVGTRYRERTGKTAQFYRVASADGAREVLA
jgi:galactokinase